MEMKNLICMLSEFGNICNADMESKRLIAIDRRHRSWIVGFTDPSCLKIERHVASFWQDEGKESAKLQSAFRLETSCCKYCGIVNSE